MMNGSLTESAVLAEGLVKSYGKVKALGGVSGTVRHSGSSARTEPGNPRCSAC